jgi:TPP-dependent pyruvate/acetoin dehydrogenase alpha subunit
VHAETADGNDVEHVLAVARDAVARCRSGLGPALVELETYRWHGHYEGDQQPYKPDAEARDWQERDPLLIAGAKLVQRGEATEEGLAAIRAGCDERVTAAVQAARLAPEPAPEEVFAHVFGD